MNSFIFKSEWLKTVKAIIVFLWSDLYCLSFVYSVLFKIKNYVQTEALSQKFSENIQMLVSASFSSYSQFLRLAILKAVLIIH